MSKQLINEYYNQYDRAIQFGKSRNEQSIRNYFWILLNSYAHKQNYELVTEVSTQGTKGAKVRPDGILKNLFGLDNGLWESKDEKDTIDDEIDAKRRKGYPFNNILFEDSNVAVLFQRQEEVMRCKVRDADELHKILTAFVTFKSETVYKFETALENFKADIPSIVKTLRDRIDETGAKNPNFKAAANSFLELCKAEINPEITLADVREMMIQHILTADIFNKIFDDPEFHRHNNIARELEKLNEILFTHTERRNLLGEIEHYYDTINACASGITDHHEKQKFLKVLYENFYKVYNPKAADRLGVVYTPNEIVNFMIESTNYLLEKHFGKNLGDKNVDILDPATGTGTFITSIIDSIPKQNLAHKYQHELHANEVAILPYYIANLNIEFTFKQKMGYYDEFKNLCFVDTLDNTASLAYSGKQHSLFGLSSENAQRIKNQNSKKISVVIGNPPYNANQQNWNEFNKNREYPYVDKRIKDTYIKESNAQKTKVYDMFARFFRWASDRVDNDGIICFVTNNAYINKKTFDGFRKSVSNEFQNAYIIDLGGDIREISGRDGIFINEEHTIFGAAAAVGIAIAFLIKDSKRKTENCRIDYIHPTDIRATRIEKLDYLKAIKFQDFPFTHIQPDKNHTWISQGEADFSELIPLIDKSDAKAIFDLASNGAATNRDEWVYDKSSNDLTEKIKYFIDVYNESIDKKKFDKRIKLSDTLKANIQKGKKAIYRKDILIESFYRPFTKTFYYPEKLFSDRLTQNHYDIFGTDLGSENKVMSFACNEQTPLLLLAIDALTDLNFCARGGTCLPLYRYDQNGNRIENITDWGLEQFRARYLSSAGGGVNEVDGGGALKKGKNKKDNHPLPPPAGDKTALTKEDIFHYTYAVLHNPAYRKKYELNLKREFPRLPFYKDFWQWAAWGKQLMELHIGYEKAKPYGLTLSSAGGGARRAEVEQKQIFNKVEEPEAMFAHKAKIKVKLKADKEEGSIELDELTKLKGIPKEAWEYKLGNRSALEWILDQYKEKKPGDPTIAEKFNTYRFADYKEQVIDLLQRVCTVSVETMKAVREMEKASPEK